MNAIADDAYFKEILAGRFPEVPEDEPVDDGNDQ